MRRAGGKQTQAAHDAKAQRQLAASTTMVPCSCLGLYGAKYHKYPTIGSSVPHIHLYTKYMLIYLSVRHSVKSRPPFACPAMPNMNDVMQSTHGERACFNVRRNARQIDFLSACVPSYLKADTACDTKFMCLR